MYGVKISVKLVRISDSVETTVVQKFLYQT